MNQVSSITAAIHAAGLTPTGLKDLLLTVDAEVPATTKARVKVILDGLCNLALTDGRKLLSETAKTDKDDKTLKVRVSEARQIYGAVKLVEGFRAIAEDSGWHRAVGEARKALIGANLKPDGGPIKTPEQRAQEQERKAIVTVLAENMVGVNTSDAEAVAEVARHAAEQARGDMFAKEIKAHANRIMEAKGKDYGLALADALMVWEPQEVEQ